MDTAIITSIISSVFTLVGVIITVISSNSKMSKALEINQAVTETKLTELTREVREHNNFAQRMPVVEEKIQNLTRKVEELERRQNET